MTHLPDRQRGLTFISLAVILAFIAIVTMMVLKLVPTYVEAIAVGSAMQSVAKEGDMSSPVQIKDALLKRLQINNIEHVGREDISVEQGGQGSFRLLVDYEVRVPFLHNIDFVVSFKDEAEVGGH